MKSAVKMLAMAICAAVLVGCGMDSAQLGEYVKKEMQAELVKKDGLKALKMSEVRLIKNEGNNYSGVGKGEVHGRPVKFDVTCQYDGNTVLWDASLSEDSLALLAAKEKARDVCESARAVWNDMKEGMKRGYDAASKKAGEYYAVAAKKVEECSGAVKAEVEDLLGDSEVLSNGKASCEVTRHGARILSFKVGGVELLWQPGKWDLKAEREWSHGGIPLCWPWFGHSAGPDKPMHGFAYKMPFEIRRRSTSGVRSEIVFGLKSSDATRKEWPYDFDLEYTVALDGDALELSLVTKNTGSAEMPVMDGYHPYLRVADRLKSRVTGVAGCKYCDTSISRKLDTVMPGDFRISGHVDHVFDIKGFVYGLADDVQKRTVKLESSGNRRLVVWSPNEEQTKENPGPGEIARSEMSHVVTVEPATLWADKAWHLAPGKTHLLFMRVTAF